MTVIIAIDPGKTTGVAMWCDSVGTLGHILTNGFSSWQASVDEFHEFLAKCTALTSVGDIHFVAESFIITINTAKNTQAPWSLELIGAFKFLASMWFNQKVTMQAPNIGKTFGTDAKLRHTGWYTRSAPHANDAARHLMTYAASRGLVFDVETLKELANV